MWDSGNADHLLPGSSATQPSECEQIRRDEHTNKTNMSVFRANAFGLVKRILGIAIMS